MTWTKKKTLWGLSYQIVQCCPSPTVEPSVGRTSLNMKSYLETEYPFDFLSHIQTSTDIGSALSDFWRNCVVWHWDTGHRIALHCESVNSEMSKMIKYLHCPAHPLCRSRGRQGKQLCTGFPPVTIVHDHDHDHGYGGRVAKCHGYDGYIRVKILASWGKSLWGHTILEKICTIYVRFFFV